MWETWVRSLGQEDLLEKQMATHASILAWRIPRTKEPGGLQSTGSQRVGHNWATSLFTIMESRKMVLMHLPAGQEERHSCWEWTSGLVLCDDLGGWNGEWGWEGGSRASRHLCAWGWFVLLYSRNEYIVKQLYSNIFLNEVRLVASLNLYQAHIHHGFPTSGLVLGHTQVCLPWEQTPRPDSVDHSPLNY